MSLECVVIGGCNLDEIHANFIHVEQSCNKLLSWRIEIWTKNHLVCSNNCPIIATLCLRNVQIFVQGTDK